MGSDGGGGGGGCGGVATRGVAHANLGSVAMIGRQRRLEMMVMEGLDE